MSWNYRVLYHDEFDEDYYDVREVYYNDDGRIKFISEHASDPHGSSLDDLRSGLDLMREALDKDVIVKSELSFGEELKIGRT